jgi:kynureninase
MQLEPEFKPVASADSWQISNPPILSMTPLRASLAIFEAAGGIEILRKKSLGLTAYLQFLLDEFAGDRAAVITPREPEERGCQLSIAVREGASDLFKKLEEHGVTCDFREPNVIRAAPTPLYNSFHEVWRFAQLLKN